MATITASMVKELRDKTGAGMMDCKKALAETGGDLEAAVDELRKRGQALASKRSGRAISEGLIFSRIEGAVGAMVELNCETDFVARNEDFKALGEHLVELAFNGQAGADAGDTKAFAASTCEAHGKTIQESVTETLAKIGENMGLGRVLRIDAGSGAMTGYIHPPGKLGVMLALETGKPESAGNEAVVQLGRDLAMHVAAAAPIAISSEDVPADVAERERKIYTEQVAMEGKPEQIREKIVDGKMKKYFKDICLVDQPFVKDPDQTVQQVIDGVAKQTGDTIKVARFERIEVGAGADEEAAE